MKHQIASLHLLTLVGALACLPIGSLLAEDTNSTPAPPAVTPTDPNAPAQAAATPAASAPAATAAVTAQPAAAKLPYGVEDVVKLNRAQISEDVILNYVANSGTTYNLAPKDIVYLRNEGVSDRVITTMMNQRQRLAEEVAQQAVAQPAVAAPAPVYSDPVPAARLYATPYVQPAQPLEAPAVVASSVYVIPYPAVPAAYYGYGPCYGGYLAGPSFVYRFGGYGGYRGGARRGWYRR